MSFVQWGIYILPNVDCLYGLCYLETNTAIQSKTKQITHILIQQFVPECTADEKKRIHTNILLQSEHLKNALGKSTPHLANLRIVMDIMPHNEELLC